MYVSLFAFAIAYVNRIKFMKFKKFCLICKIFFYGSLYIVKIIISELIGE